MARMFFILAKIQFLREQAEREGHKKRAQCRDTVARKEILINTLRKDVFYNNYTSVEASARGAVVDARDWMRAEHAKYFKAERKPSLRLERILQNK